MKIQIQNSKFKISNSRFKIQNFTLLLAVFVMLLAACGPTPPATFDPVTLTIAVAPACEPLMADLADAYHAEYPHVSFHLLNANSPAAIEAALYGQADLAAVSQISTTETIWLTAVAVDNISVIVHPSNPVKNLGLLQLRDIFHGRDSAWSEAGGMPNDITIVTRERRAEVRADFEALVLEGRNVTLNALVAPSPQAVIDMVSAITTAVGYVSMGYRPAGVRMIAVDGVLPTPLTAADRSYPIHRALYFVAAQEPESGPQGYLRDFVAWVLSPQGQLVVGQRYGRVGKID